MLQQFYPVKNACHSPKVEEKNILKNLIINVPTNRPYDLLFLIQPLWVLRICDEPLSATLKFGKNVDDCI